MNNNQIEKKMIIENFSEDQLSINASDPFKSEIMEFKLILKNKLELKIPVSKDGYVNCTKLCQAGNKRIDSWIRLKQSKALIEAYSKLPHICGGLILRSVEGRNGGSFYPIDIAIQIAQWIDPYFALQVSSWTKELFLFGKVTLGEEKSAQELEKMYQDQIETLTNQFRLKEEELEQDLEDKTDKLKKLNINHKALLVNRTRTVFQIGNVFYVVSHKAFSDHYEELLYKFGIATQKKNETVSAFMSRLSGYNTGAPEDYTVHYVLYVENNDLIEKMVKLKFKNTRRKEWIKGVKLLDVVMFVRNAVKMLGIDYKDDVVDKELEKEINNIEEERNKDKIKNIAINNNDYRTTNITINMSNLLGDKGYEYKHNKLDINGQLVTLSTLTDFINKNKKSGENYKCLLGCCKNEYNSLRSLQEHIKIYHFKQSITCPLCIMNFTVKSSLVKHIKSQHVTNR
jgi:hypothetical protein